MHISALTFGTLLSSQESDAHRAPHSRVKLRGNPPNTTVPSAARQIGHIPAQPPVSQPPTPAQGVFRLPEPSGRSEQPAASASRTRSNKKNITDIRGEDANRLRHLGRTLAKHLRRACPPSLLSHQSPASPPVPSTIVPYDTRAAEMADRRGASSPPIEYRIVQQTPLGEWPLVAAECEARGSCTERHQV
jgi:hypothetical protein